MACRDQSKRDLWEHNHAPPTTLDGNIDDWFMRQRQREKELRKRRQEAEQLLHGFRGYYDVDWLGSPRRKSRGGRSSLDQAMDDSLPDPNHHIRRQSALPRLASNWVRVEGDEDSEFGHFFTSPNPLDPNRMSFLSEHQHYDGTQYPRTEQDMEVADGVKLFNDETAEEIVQGGPGKTPYKGRYMNIGIDTAASEERLRKAGGRTGLEGISERSGFSNVRLSAFEDSELRDSTATSFRGDEDESMLREGPSFNNPNKVVDALPETVWRDFISKEPGAKFPPETGRYHLYASYACPGSHRALIVRALKGLEDIISVTIVHPTWRHTNPKDPDDKHRGWVFGDPNGKPFQNTMGRGGPFPPAYHGNDPDPILNAYSVRELYESAKDTSGKYTIPLLWDKKLNTIVNNESSDISYMLNSCFNDFAKASGLDLYTEDDEDGLDRLNEVSQWLYPMMIHGVYRCGFAKTQRAYNQAIQELTEAFDAADELLQHQRYLTGNTLTDADIRLFVTLLRFDEVYAFYFRANTRLVMMTPSLLNFCREIYQMPGVAETCQMEQIKAHFFGSHAEWNKYSVVPRGLGFMKHLEVPHNRDEVEFGS